jgi:hypothetical protein
VDLIQTTSEDVVGAKKEEREEQMLRKARREK